jgi:hypothetical protein
MFRPAVLLLSACHVLGNMYDVIESEKVPPASCTHGCAAWSTCGSKIDALWVNGKPTADAPGHCAQPGMSVDTYTLGSWCVCRNSTDPTAALGSSERS